ncbi:replication fork protection component swi3 domain-containing protein [Sarocladium implicatum]|nr:replication fork protection component swi3 domain-containing protein [Sarocladium implicatum]
MAPATLSSPRHDDIDNYDAGDLSDDPFASPPPDSAAKKRKANGDGGLGIDEEVSVQKRARVPNVKLDEDRLLGPAGLPKLQKRASGLKIKGKGHEFSDAARLLSFYQLWLDDLFPKAKFLDALAMVEKAGHKKRLVAARNEWISDGQRRQNALANGEAMEDEPTESRAAQFTTMVNATDQPSTPPRGDVPDDDDLYDATPRAARQPNPSDDVPEEDDLDALIAEAEANDRGRQPAPRQTAEEPDELDALIAEAEELDRSRSGPPKGTADRAKAKDDDNFADEEAAMHEMEGLW